MSCATTGAVRLGPGSASLPRGCRRLAAASRDTRVDGLATPRAPAPSCIAPRRPTAVRRLGRADVRPQGLSPRRHAAADECRLRSPGAAGMVGRRTDRAGLPGRPVHPGGLGTGAQTGWAHSVAEREAGLPASPHPSMVRMARCAPPSRHPAPSRGSARGAPPWRRPSCTLAPGSANCWQAASQGTYWRGTHTSSGASRWRAGTRWETNPRHDLRNPVIRRRSPSWLDGDLLRSRSPDGIRTRATALRGRRARPLHNGALQEEPSAEGASGLAGVPGLEPELAVPETAGLPITPYPMGSRVVTPLSVYTGPRRPPGRSERS